MNGFDTDKYFGKEDETQSESSRTVGKVGIWFLHLVKVLFVTFTGYHVFHAGLDYASGSVTGIVTNVIGLLAVEMTMIGLYLAAYNKRINGTVQRGAAVATYAVCFALAALGVITDGWMNRGENDLTPFLQFYLDWLLLLAPFFAIAGSLIVHFTSPEKLRQMREATVQDRLKQTMFDARIAAEKATLEEGKAIKTMQLEARQAVLQQLYQVYTGEDVRQAITATAIQNAPALLKQAGIDVDALGLTPQLVKPPLKSIPRPTWLQPSLPGVDPGMVFPAEKMYLLCAYRESGDCPVLAHGPLAVAKAAYHERKVKDPGKQYFIIDAETQAFVEGDKPANWQAQAARGEGVPDPLAVSPNGHGNGSG